MEMENKTYEMSYGPTISFVFLFNFINFIMK